MIEKQKAKRRLTDFNFEESGSHVALVHKEQGGPANLYTTLLTKSTSDITDQQVRSEEHTSELRHCK